MGHVIVGTAGHIDHGKSSLVRALTGTDPDRLPEEKRRNITIDLGYAFLDDIAAIIDVPGHEKFIHNMVAGAATVDFALLVIAADDGVMPQTREHLHILRLLGIKFGAIVITKTGMTEKEWRELVKEQIRSVVRGTFLEDARIFEVDSLKGEGIAALKSYLLSELPKLPRRSTSDVLRIPIDRVFNVHGHGTVVTGTVLSGTVEREQKVELCPGSIPARVKQLQTNAHEQVLLGSGMRAALNLSTERLPVRGQTLTQPGALLSSRRLGIRFEQITDAPLVKDRQRIRVLIGTQEVMGRFRILGEDETHKYALLLLDQEVVAAFGDRMILRRYSPLDTLGGGVVLDVDPTLRGRFRQQSVKLMQSLTAANSDHALPLWLAQRHPYSVSTRRACAMFAMSETAFKDRYLKTKTECRSHAGFAFNIHSVTNWKSALQEKLTQLHKQQPSESGFSAQQLSITLPQLPPQLLDWTLAELVQEKSILHESGLFKASGATRIIDSTLLGLMDEVMLRLSQDGFTPSSSAVLSESLNKPKRDIEQALVTASRTDRAMRLGTDMFFDRAVFDNAIDRVRSLLTTRGSLQVSDLSKELNSSRKYIVPFLEYLDTQGITERRGNDRVPGRNFNR